MRFKSLVLFLGLLPAAQFLFSQYNLTERSGDFNGDGFADSLRYYYEGGSGFGGWEYYLRDGKSGKSWELYNGGCYCNIRELIYIPEDILKPEFAALWDSARSKLFGPILTEPDPVSEWLLSANQNFLDFPEGSEFVRLIAPQVPWRSAPLPEPKGHSIWLEAGTAAKMDEAYWGDRSIEDLEGKKPLLAVNGGIIDFGMDEPQPELRVGKYTLIPHKHGIRLRQGKQEKWLFITDFPLTGGVDKLRWTSLSELISWGKEKVILRLRRWVTQPDGVFVLDLRSGRILELASPAEGEESIQVEKDLLRIRFENQDTGENELKELSLESVKDALDQPVQPR